MKRFVAAVCASLAIAAAPAVRPTSRGEAATARRFAALRHRPLELRVFLREMPKGGDLHNHLSGSIYAETYLRWAADDGLCFDVATIAIVAAPCSADAGRPPVGAVLRDRTLYNRAIDATSMRNWDPALNGHDHFFAGFRFGPTSTKLGDMTADVASRAAAEHVSYLELMVSPSYDIATRFARSVSWNPDLAKFRDGLLAAGFRDQVVAEGRQRLDALESRARELLGCSTTTADAGCGVTIRYILQVPRSAPREQVFAAMLAGFELSAADPRVVSVNLVQPEDDAPAVDNFAPQMQMLDYLHREYPRMPITLHAGELTPGLVPPPVLRSHIRQSIEVGHAIRIGHGVDVMEEDDPFGLLREMAARHVLVEVALTTNRQILGVTGDRHPLRTYLRNGVPVALVTDDMGVARSSHTQEFVTAAEEQGLDYPTLKQLARNSLRYAFVDAATKQRLLSDLDKAFDAFEGRWR